MNLSENLSDDLKCNFSEELLKNVFRDGERVKDLLLNEADIISIARSDRAMNRDDHIVSEDTEGVMKLKKTTILTGNFAPKEKRDRA